MSSRDDDLTPGRRSDVGYGRPPVETQFQKGQKPPPRKKKASAPPSVADLFWKVLNERRRVIFDGKPTWLRNSELIAHRAFLEAEKGSAVLNRLLIQLLLPRDEAPQDAMPEIIVDPTPPEDGIVAGAMTVRDGPPGDNGSRS